MQFRHREHSMNTLQILHVADNDLLINIENRHQIRSRVCDVAQANKSRLSAKAVIDVAFSRLIYEWQLQERRERLFLAIVKSIQAITQSIEIHSCGVSAEDPIPN